ncbi:MAG: TIGR03905 family TSCPD domain-containing protein [Coriobacteriaceae bacterium]|nr:TIGR03905 family TSCPD domain-containing protein [Coriobacteriaceae bacterium]
MTDLDFKPRGVCARMIHVELSDDGATIENVAFEGGCNGNLKAIGKLVAGQPVEDIVTLLEGNTCGPRKTSCADQLTLALREAASQAKA